MSSLLLAVASSASAPAMADAVAKAPSQSTQSAKTDVYVGGGEGNLEGPPSPRLFNSPSVSMGATLNVLLPGGPIPWPDYDELVQEQIVWYQIPPSGACNSAADIAADVRVGGTRWFNIQNVQWFRGQELANKQTAITVPLNATSGSLCLYAMETWLNRDGNYQSELTIVSSPLQLPIESPLSGEVRSTPVAVSPVLSLTNGHSIWQERATFSFGLLIDGANSSEGDPIRRDLIFSYTDRQGVPCANGRAIRQYDLLQRGAGWGDYNYASFEVLPNSAGKYLCAQQRLVSATADSLSEPTFVKIVKPVPDYVKELGKLQTATSDRLPETSLGKKLALPTSSKNYFVVTRTESNAKKQAPTITAGKSKAPQGSKPVSSFFEACGKTCNKTVLESSLRPLAPIPVRASSEAPYVAIVGANGFEPITSDSEIFMPDVPELYPYPVIAGDYVAFAGAVSPGSFLSGSERVTARTIHQGYATTPQDCRERRVNSNHVTNAPTSGAITLIPFSTTTGNGVAGTGLGPYLCAWQTLTISSGSGANSLTEEYTSESAIVRVLEAPFIAR